MKGLILTLSVLTRDEPQPAPQKASTVKLDPRETLDVILTRLDDMKAEDTITIDLRGKSPMSDYMVITSGRANRHVGAIAENVMRGLKEAGVDGVRGEGLAACDWVLIDAGDVVVHVFRPEVRTFYNLERMWMPGAEKVS